MPSRGVNKVILIGNLGQEPDVKYMPDGNAVANVTLATSERWKSKSGEPQERTEWHKLVFYRKLAENVGKYLRKGSRIYAEGKIRTREWQDKDGNNRYTTEIVVNEMKMLDNKPSGAQPQQQQQGFDNDNPMPGMINIDDEDIPF